MSQNKNVTSFFDDLPGGELVSLGLADLERNIESKYTLLLSIAGPRLRGLGIDIPERYSPESFEHKLYGLLEEEHGDGAYSFYNSLVRRIVSFERSLTREHRMRRSSNEV